MRGTIWCESEVGGGSTFYFTALFDLPAEAHSAAAAAANNPEAEEARNARLAGARVLLAEDNEVNRMIAVEFLRMKDVLVDVACNGREALALLKKSAYDLVLMDIQMPEMDGITATRRIRKLKKYKDLPILALTAHALAHDRELSLAAAMNDHLVKPIDPETLYNALYKWLPDKKRAALQGHN